MPSPPPASLRLALVEDDLPTAEQLVALLTREGMEIASVSHDAAALPDIVRTRPDAVLCDLYLGRRPAFGLLAGLHHALPDTPVIVLTAYEDAALLFEALRAGACGYVLKADRSRPLAAAVREALDGGTPFSPAVARHVLRHFRSAADDGGRLDRLTDGQRLVLRRIAEGRANKEIAAELGVSESAVKKQVTRLLQKLRVPTRAAAAGLLGGWR
jgi:DNA-binding NarL/FixJ family response regulator